MDNKALPEESPPSYTPAVEVSKPKPKSFSLFNLFSRSYEKNTKKTAVAVAVAVQEPVKNEQTNKHEVKKSQHQNTSKTPTPTPGISGAQKTASTAQTPQRPVTPTPTPFKEKFLGAPFKKVITHGVSSKAFEVLSLEDTVTISFDGEVVLLIDAPCKVPAGENRLYGYIQPIPYTNEKAKEVKLRNGEKVIAEVRAAQDYVFTYSGKRALCFKPTKVEIPVGDGTYTYPFPDSCGGMGKRPEMLLVYPHVGK